VLRSLHMAVRRWLAVACFGLLVVVSISPENLRLPFGGRARLHRVLTLFPDHGAWWPDYPLFLLDVRGRTRNGDSIALVVPVTWASGYDYAFYRASYFLAGREVLPIRMPDRSLPGNVRMARYVAVWPQSGAVPNSLRLVIAAHRGALFER
jgi:hypothetical protein